MMGGRVTFIIIFIAATLVCGYDVFMALNHRPLSWVLAAVMALIALLTLRKLVRQDYTSTWW